MDRAFKRQKRKFKNSLEPIMVMLLDRKNQMDPASWRTFMQRTRDNILKNTGEFVVDEFRDPKLTRELVEDIFADFCKEMQSRSTLKP
jgi:hypothetical protein